jgi:hypothetical protein
MAGYIAYSAGPISTAAPNPGDTKQTNDLEKVCFGYCFDTVNDPTALLAAQLLHEEHLFETNEESTLREDVLGQLDRLVKDWVTAVARKKFLPDAIRNAASSKIYTFGSYRLGVHGPGMAELTWHCCGLPVIIRSRCVGADMDVLCVGPQYVTREEDFFGETEGCLQYMLQVCLAQLLPPLTCNHD